MTKPQVYLIAAALFAIAGCYIITIILLGCAFLFGVAGKLPKPPTGGQW